MLSPQIKECRNCNSLKDLKELVECSILNLARNKLNNENYNVETYYSSSQMKALSRYKRILNRKLYNPTYLTDIANDDLVFLVSKLVYGKCPVCIDCDIPAEDTTTTAIPVPTTTTSTTSSIL